MARFFGFLQTLPFALLLYAAPSACAEENQLLVWNADSDISVRIQRNGTYDHIDIMVRHTFRYLANRDNNLYNYHSIDVKLPIMRMYLLVAVPPGFLVQNESTRSPTEQIKADGDDDGRSEPWKEGIPPVGGDIDRKEQASTKFPTIMPCLKGENELWFLLQPYNDNSDEHLKLLRVNIDPSRPVAELYPLENSVDEAFAPESRIEEYVQWLLPKTALVVYPRPTEAEALYMLNHINSETTQKMFAARYRYTEINIYGALESPNPISRYKWKEIRDYLEAAYPLHDAPLNQDELNESYHRYPMDLVMFNRAHPNHIAELVQELKDRYDYLFSDPEQISARSLKTDNIKTLAATTSDVSIASNFQRLWTKYYRQVALDIVQSLLNSRHPEIRHLAVRAIIDGVDTLNDGDCGFSKHPEVLQHAIALVTSASIQSADRSPLIEKLFEYQMRRKNSSSKG